MIVRCTCCQVRFDMPEKQFEFAAVFAAYYNTTALFRCETCTVNGRIPLHRFVSLKENDVE